MVAHIFRKKDEISKAYQGFEGKKQLNYHINLLSV